MAAVTTAIMAGLSFGQAYSKSQDEKAAGDYAKRVGESNAAFSAIQADDAIVRGDKDAADYNKNLKVALGSARASAAAQGLDPNSGSFAEVSDQTKLAGAQDMQIIKSNAWREAWGFRVEGANASGQGRLAEVTAQNSSRNTLITGGLQAGGYATKALYYDTWKKSGKQDISEQNKGKI